MFTKIAQSFSPFALVMATMVTAPMVMSAPAYAAGDLLVAPTRVVLDGRRGTEVILNNIGEEEATYRISLELRRMNDVGRLEEVPEEAANEKEQAIQRIIRYAPRRVTLPPNQPQSIRIGLTQMQDLPDGEYRAHMLFRAIPKTAAVTDTEDAGDGVQIQLIPVYGVTIPIIVRKGQLEAQAALANPRVESTVDGPALAFDLSRKGSASVFGEIRVSKPGISEPVMVARGIAIYPELESRVVTLPVNEEILAALKGPVTIGYYEAVENGGALISEVKSVLN
ncbi:molecular chaperone [Sphingorhabdus arenilitoris]|uniref:Molecular chaperone n=1 Tax=Sphingorhabdus arenilitoris TaxID=1490041 RepID=A0ABV8RD78_9SPHN